MDPHLLLKAKEVYEKGQSYAFATVIEATIKGTPRKSGAKMLVVEDSTLFGSIGGGRNELAAKKECLKSIKNGKPKLVTYDYFGQKGQSVCGGQIKVFIEPFHAQKHLIICGAGHIALPLSVISKILNYKVTIIDNRKIFANTARFKHVDKIIVGRHAKKLTNININQNTYIMIVTQGNEYDFECLKVALNTKAGYIGVISSETKKKKFLKRLKEEGFPIKNFKNISIPAGLDLGAQTPEEIAVSIAAEFVKQTNKGLLKSNKFQSKKYFNFK